MQITIRFLILIFFILLNSCSNDYKADYCTTRVLDTNKYVEIYMSSNFGVYGGSSFSYYYTDSSGTSIFIDNIDDDYEYDIHIKDKILYALKYKYVFVGFRLPSKIVYCDVKAINTIDGTVIE